MPTSDVTLSRKALCLIEYSTLQPLTLLNFTRDIMNGAKTLGRLLVLLLATGCTSGAMAQDCNALLLHGLRNISVTKSADASLVTQWNSYCGTKYEGLSSSIQAAVDVDIIGIGGGSGSLSTQEKNERLQNWCNQNASLAKASQSLYQDSRPIFQGAVDAWSRCNELATKRSLNQNYTISDDQRNVSISLQADAGSLGVPYLGTNAEGFQCTQVLWDERTGSRPIQSGTPTIIKGFAIKITCRRSEANLGNGRVRLPRGNITVQTGQLQDISLFFPEEVQPPFEETARLDILGKIGSLCMGCIQASPLSEEQFQALNGKGWVLCDGRSVEGSKYARATKVTKAPDLRGVFLRGVNSKRFSDVEEVSLGEYRADAVGSHKHPIEDPGHEHPMMIGGDGPPDVSLQWSWNNGGIQVRPDKLIRSAKTGITVGANGNDETRPKSVTVNYFLKVN